MYNRARTISALIGAVLTLTLLSMNSSAQGKRSAATAPQGPVRIRVFDAYSGLSLANTAIEVTSDNGIACIQMNCPTNGQTWTGQSDVSGTLVIPASAIQLDTFVKTKDHRLERLPEDAIKNSSEIRQVELYPEWLFDEQHEWTRGYKLVDAHSGKVLASTSVRIEFPANDWPGQHGGVSNLAAKTNLLGYVFFSFLRKPEAKQGQPLPDVGLADWMTPEASIAVSGYEKTKLNYFDGSKGERSAIRLHRQSLN